MRTVSWPAAANAMLADSFFGYQTQNAAITNAMKASTSQYKGSFHAPACDLLKE